MFFRPNKFLELWKIFFFFLLIHRPKCVELNFEPWSRWVLGFSLCLGRDPRPKFFGGLLFLV